MFLQSISIKKIYNKIYSSIYILFLVLYACLYFRRLWNLLGWNHIVVNVVGTKYVYGLKTIQILVVIDVLKYQGKVLNGKTHE